MRFVRITALALLIINCVLVRITDWPWSDLVTYNAIGIAGLISLIMAPERADKGARKAIFLGILMWVLGSTVATLANSLDLPSVITTTSDLFYLLFYPFMLIGAARLLGINRGNQLLDIVDALIISLGLATLGTAFFLQPVLPQFGSDFKASFLAVFYPVADLILVSVVLTSFLIQGFSRRGLLLSAGILIFTVNDFFFLWLTVNSSYSIGGVVDTGWLVSILLICESFWHSGIDTTIKDGANPIFISVAVLLSATLLAVIALSPDYLPHFVLIPAIATLALAFSRMAIALSQARHIGQERLLARTDELTGLPNRRRLISEIEEFITKEGSLLLLDLDGFKPINDRYGHEIGDKVLQQVALRFDRALPSRALLARLGGDEFGVLFEGGQDSALEIALALRATLSYPFHIENKEILLGVSIGVAKNNGEDDLLRRADTAMYTAKREGLGVYPL
jgi:diguanylate cyclase (GGDEF)-like protein